MNEELTMLLEQAESVKRKMEENFVKAFADIEKIEDEKAKEFLKNSLSLAKNNKLDIDQFLKEVKNYV